MATVNLCDPASEHHDHITPTNDSRVEIRVRGRWIGVPALDINGKKIIVTGRWLKTARVRGEEMMESELETPEECIQKLKSDAVKPLKADIFTFTQKPPATQPKYAYPMEWESIAAVNVVSFKSWWEGLPQETRKNVRRSQKRGVSVVIKEFDDELIQGIREVNDDAPVRQGTRNGYYGKSAEETKKLYGEFVGRCDFVCAYFGGKLIGFLHLVHRGKVASILNLTTKPSHFDKRPANALVAKAMELCEAKGVSYITYGQYNYGNKRDDPLRTFKIRNGFEEILMPRFFVPLNGWGRLCMRAKLHRGFIGILPPFVIRIAKRVRSLWYNLAVSRYRSTEEQPNCNGQIERRSMEGSSPPARSST